MSEGGRVVNHEIHLLPDPKANIILVGYQSVGTLGRKLQDGAGEVGIWENGKMEKAKPELAKRRQRRYAPVCSLFPFSRLPDA